MRRNLTHEKMKNYSIQPKAKQKPDLPDGLGERKILNPDVDLCQGSIVQNPSNDFLAAANSFKTALKSLNHDESDGRFCKLLSAIQNQIKQKIAALQKHKQQNVESASLNTSKLMATSMQSLCSEKSTADEFSEDCGEYKGFNTNVSCPFCFKCENDKNSLVKHIDEACSAIKKNEFTTSIHTPYSVFQILPNNTFKCNVCSNAVQRCVMGYFLHLQSYKHTSNFTKAASHKTYTDLIFCSCCKVQIPNNATQILFHMDLEIHQMRSGAVPDFNFFRKKGVMCLYNRSKKFKCLSCPSGVSIHETTTQILNHFESKVHLEQIKFSHPTSLFKYLVHCVFCSIEVRVVNVISHFTSKRHLKNEEEKKNDGPFEVCYYCGFDCTDLAELATHMKFNCATIHEIREVNGLKESDESDEDSEKIPEGEETKKHQEISVKEKEERPRKENSNEKGTCVLGRDASAVGRLIVEDCVNLPALLHYFKKFGEILEAETTGRVTLIKFKEENTVDAILQSHDMININGMKLKIRTFENHQGSDTRGVTSNPDKTSRSDDSDDKSGHGSTSRNRNSDSKHSTDAEHLENLFYRVSTHLTNSLLKPEGLNIALECNQNLKVGDFEYVGFLKCGLTFTVENVTLYCRLKNDLIGERCLNNDFVCLAESSVYNRLLAQNFALILRNSDMVTNVSALNESSFHVEFTHVKTKNTCTVTFKTSSIILTNMLSCCLSQNENIRDFILIIRFWLSVHKLRIKEFEFVLISLLLFFLVNSGAARIPSDEFGSCRGYKEIKKVLQCTGKPKFAENSQNSGGLQNKISIKEMFQNFLRFLNAFDFEKYAICLPCEHPVPKDLLLAQPLSKFLCKLSQEEGMDSGAWIMDPFLHNNMALDLRKEDLDSLLKIVRDTVKHYKIC